MCLDSDVHSSGSLVDTQQKAIQYKKYNLSVLT